MGSKWGNYHNVENSLKCFLISGFELKKKRWFKLNGCDPMKRKVLLMQAM